MRCTAYFSLFSCLWCLRIESSCYEFFIAISQHSAKMPSFFHFMSRESFFSFFKLHKIMWISHENISRVEAASDMLMAYQLKHERVLLEKEERERERKEREKRVMKTLAVALHKTRLRKVQHRDDLLNFQLREIQFILCTYFPQKFKSTSQQEDNTKKILSTYTTWWIDCRINGSAAASKKKATSSRKCSRSVSVYMCVNRLCNIFSFFFN